MNLNVLLGNTGPSWTISAACASGAYAIGQAADQIRLGRLDRVVCGAAQEVNWPSVCSFDGLGAFSARTPAEAASRPFDKGRDGLVPSGGAAALLLEDYDTARSRNACILAEVLGFGCSADGETLSVPSRTGLARAMRMALAEGGLSTADVDIVNAHAAGHTHLLLRQFIIRKTFKSRIRYRSNCWMGFQKLRYLHCIAAMAIHTNGQCLHAAGNQKCIKRAEYSTSHIF